MHTSKKIKSVTLLETQNQNKYIYDRGKKHFQLCHPFFYYLVQAIQDGGEDIKPLDLMNPNSREIESNGYFSKQEREYYFRKYMLLKNNGYFPEVEPETKPGEKLSADVIKYNLANLNEVVFEVTDRCNLNCQYCGYGQFYDNFDKRERKDMDIKMAMNLLDYLSDMWNSPLNQSKGKYIDIGFYGGEPLLNYSLIEKVVDYVKQKKFIHNFFKFSITTNGTLIKKHMNFLYENNFWVSISLDGNKNNNAYRIFKNRKPTYNLIVENIRALEKKYPDYFSSNVNFISVLHRKNSVSEIYNYFKEHFNKVPVISSLNTSGVKESSKKKFWEMYVNVNQSLHESEDYSLIEKDMFSRLPNVRDIIYLYYSSNNFIFSNYNHLLYDNYKEKKFPSGTCLPFNYKIFLTVKGKILTCERIGNQFGLGAVTPEGVELDFEKIAWSYNSYYDKLREQCSACYNAETCKQCMFNLKTVNDKKIKCNGIMDEKRYSKYISSFLSSLEKNPETFAKLLKRATFTDKKGEPSPGNGYWFYIETYVHIAIKSNSSLLYNSLTGKTLEYSKEKKILNLLMRMLSLKNQQVVLLKKSQLENPVISQFVSDVKKHFMGDIIAASYSKGKPIQMMPKVIIKRDVNFLKKNNYTTVGENALAYLTEIFLYISNKCSQKCNICNSAYKQFTFCTLNKKNNKHLDIKKIKILFAQLKGSSLAHLNILGGDIFTHPSFEELIDIVEGNPADITFYVHYLNLTSEKSDLTNRLKLLRKQSLLLTIYVTFPLDEKKLKAVLDAVKAVEIKYQFMFVVQNENEFLEAESIILSLNIDYVDYRPFYNGRNLDFFRENVFWDKDEVISCKPTLKQIYQNSFINTLNFGRLSIFSNGAIHTNANTSRLGILGENSIYDVLSKELCYGKSWRRVRKNVAPCKQCSFQALCPPLTNYSYAIGKNNLCTYE
jgi:uncharacterized protein